MDPPHLSGSTNKYSSGLANFLGLALKMFPEWKPHFPFWFHGNKNKGSHREATACSPYLGSFRAEMNVVTLLAIVRWALASLLSCRRIKGAP